MIFYIYYVFVCIYVNRTGGDWNLQKKDRVEE